MGSSFNRKASGVSTMLLTITLVWGLPAIPVTSFPASTCLPVGCNWPSVSTERTHCYEIGASTCSFNEEIRQSSPAGENGYYYVYIPGVLPPTSQTYKNDYACIWKFPSLGECERYHIKIHSMNLKGADSCTCADHVLLGHSGDQSNCITYDNNSTIPDSNTDITIKFRSDGSDTANGFLIVIYKHNNAHCAENMDEDTFDIRTIPSIDGCPSFTLGRVKEHLELVKKMIGENAHSDMKLVIPLKQCYCFGTCTAKDEEERETLIASFIKPTMYTANNFINSPDSVLRNMARVAQSIIEENGKEEKL